MGSLADSIRPLTGGPRDYDELVERAGHARVVLIGEASHGTAEFYGERAAITRRLIVEQGFAAVAAEADWPDAYRVNRFVRGRGNDRSAREALAGFERFPAWMWRNDVVLDFATWLRAHNDSLEPRARKVGFYGLDLYSLFGSMAAVLRYLERVDPEAAKRARYRYSCFDHCGEDSQAYGYAASYGIGKTCENEAVEQLLDLMHKGLDYAREDGAIANDDFFAAEQNARVVKNAEEYYRTMFRGRVSSWNLRDQHMGQTLDALLAHLDSHAPGAKVVVWAHNSHLGDARATEMGEGGELNVGQLARERYGAQAMLVGFSTYEGTVTAASDWDQPSETKRGHATEEARERRLQRAIGVIYRPDTERLSHYFHARLADQFDAMIHIDSTSALHPLERVSEPTHEPETFPTGR